MLVIRQVQMEVFEADARARAMERLAAHLRATCRAQTAEWTSERLRAEVDRGVEQARRYGIERESDLAVFLECRVELGEDFDTREDTAWAGAVLRDDTLFGEDKAAMLSERHLTGAGATEAP